MKLYVACACAFSSIRLNPTHQAGGTKEQAYKRLRRKFQHRRKNHRLSTRTALQTCITGRSQSAPTYTTPHENTGKRSTMLRPSSSQKLSIKMTPLISQLLYRGYLKMRNMAGFVRKSCQRFKQWKKVMQSMWNWAISKLLQALLIALWITHWTTRRTRNRLKWKRSNGSIRHLVIL